MATPVTVNDVLDGHVVLDLECLDRVYLNGYVPNLQVGGQVVSFLTEHLGNPIPSPAIFEKIGLGFPRSVGRFANDEAICDRLGPATIDAFVQRWLAVLPLPLIEHDRAGGYWWELSMRQVEVSRTIVFTAPRHARAFFEALVADHLDLGRPEQVELIFKRGQPRDRKAAGIFKTEVVTYGTEVNVNAFYRHSRIKQFLKDGRALRIETVINDPYDLGCQRRLHNLGELRTKARAVNRRLLDTQRVGRAASLRVQP